MINIPRLTEILDLLLRRGLIHAGQRQDVLNRGADQARHILLDRRAEMRRLLGRHRVNYRVHEIELVASFRFKRADEADEALTEEVITRVVADHVGLPFVYLDPLRLDYKLVTESFGGPFAERHLVITLADPWDKDLFEGIVRAKNKTVRPVLAQKAQLIQVIVEFHGFRRSMRAAEVEYATDLPDLGNLEQLYEARGGAEVDSNDQPVVRAVWYLLNYAFDQRASDIHVEPKRGETWVRMRIDGVLHRIHRLPKVVHNAVLSRAPCRPRLAKKPASACLIPRS